MGVANVKTPKFYNKICICGDAHNIAGLIRFRLFFRSLFIKKLAVLRFQFVFHQRKKMVTKTEIRNKKDEQENGMGLYGPKRTTHFVGNYVSSSYILCHIIIQMQYAFRRKLFPECKTECV